MEITPTARPGNGFLKFSYSLRAWCLDRLRAPALGVFGGSAATIRIGWTCFSGRERVTGAIDAAVLLQFLSLQHGRAEKPERSMRTLNFATITARRPAVHAVWSPARMHRPARA